MNALAVPLGCAVCGVPRRRHDADDHRYEPPSLDVARARAAAWRKRVAA